jgi:hypothetical protein
VHAEGLGETWYLAQEPVDFLHRCHCSTEKLNAWRRKDNGRRDCVTTPGSRRAESTRPNNVLTRKFTGSSRNSRSSSSLRPPGALFNSRIYCQALASSWTEETTNTVRRVPQSRSTSKDNVDSHENMSTQDAIYSDRDNCWIAPNLVLCG